MIFGVEQRKILIVIIQAVCHPRVFAQEPYNSRPSSFNQPSTSCFVFLVTSSFFVFFSRPLPDLYAVMVEHQRIFNLTAIINAYFNYFTVTSGFNRSKGQEKLKKNFHFCKVHVHVRNPLSYGLYIVKMADVVEEK